jgi:hypothetical protein
MIFIINWKKLISKNFIFDQVENYECFRKNYGYFDKSYMTFKIVILHFPAMADDIILKSYGFIKRTTTLDYEPHILLGIKNGLSFFSVFFMISEQLLNNCNNERACSDSVLHPKAQRFSDEALVDSSCGGVEKVFKTLVRQSPPGSNERVRGSPDAVSPFFETLFYYPDERTRVLSETRDKNTDTFSSFSSEDWHPFQRFDKDGVPERFDILNSFSNFLSVFDNSKSSTKTPNLITEEVNVAFTIYINWLNHARVVNFTHVFWYIEFKTNNFVISWLTRFSWHSGAFMWTTPLSREWAGLFLRHGLLEASPTNTSDSFYLSKIYFKSTRVTFKRILL